MKLAPNGMSSTHAVPKSRYERASVPDFEYYDKPADPAHPEKMELSVYWPIG